MTVIFAAVSRWFLAGGWKIVGIAALAIAGLIFVNRVFYWKAEAAKVPGLEQKLSDYDKRAEQVLNKLLEAEQKRGAAEAALTAWQNYKSNITVQLQESARNAPASTNPVCLPTDPERKLRNDAIKQLLGPSGSGSELPNASGTPH